MTCHTSNRDTCKLENPESCIFLQPMEMLNSIDNEEQMGLVLRGLQLDFVSFIQKKTNQEQKGKGKQTKLVKLDH